MGIVNKNKLYPSVLVSMIEIVTQRCSSLCFLMVILYACWVKLFPGLLNIYMLTMKHFKLKNEDVLTENN